MLSVDARKLLDEATRVYHAQISLVTDYLRGRGISSEAASMFRLGYVSDPMIGHEQYMGRLAIPYLTPTGTVDIRFRALREDDSPKYLSRPGAEGHLFGVLALQQDTDTMTICEGELDTIVATAECGIPAVGVPGSNGWKHWYGRAFSDYRRVIVLCDGDQAGRDLGKRVAQQIDTAVVIAMPDGMDVTDVYLAEGVDGVRKRAGL